MPRTFQSWLSVHFTMISLILNQNVNKFYYYYFKMNWIPFINDNIVEHLFKSFVPQNTKYFSCEKSTVQLIKMPAKYIWIELENNAIITCSEVRTDGCSKQLTIEQHFDNPKHSFIPHISWMCFWHWICQMDVWVLLNYNNDNFLFFILKKMSWLCVFPDSIS